MSNLHKETIRAKAEELNKSKNNQGYQSNQCYQSNRSNQEYQSSQSNQSNQGNQGNQGYQSNQGNQGYQSYQSNQGYQSYFTDFKPYLENDSSDNMRNVSINKYAQNSTESGEETLDDIVLSIDKTIGCSPIVSMGDKTKLLLAVLQNRKENTYDKETRKVLYNEKVLSHDEVKRHTLGYIIVPRDQWENISQGSHILYLGMDEKHRSGGYVKFKSEKNNKWFFQLENKQGKRANDPSYISYPVLFENIKLLYKKIDPAASVEINMIKKDLAAKREQIDHLCKQIVAVKQEKIRLEERMLLIEEDNKKIKSILKRLAR